LPEKTGAKAPSGERAGLSQSFKRELIKWYYGAMYRGSIKTAKKNSTSFPISTKKSKNL